MGASGCATLSSSDSRECCRSAPPCGSSPADAAARPRNTPINPCVDLGGLASSSARNPGAQGCEQMLLLIAFGFVAGAGTAVSPCVLPVLPIVLAAGATSGRRRPLGIVAGLVASFTFSTVALVYVISA